jgi:L-methionine (R)-S-oxide reductase
MRSSSFTDTAHDRRHALRQKVNTPAFASFDGVTGGMILDLSEEGMAMKSQAPLEAHTIVPLRITLGEPAANLETTGYVAWADALGRAGVRFSDLPDEARGRLREWLTTNASAPSWRAPRWVVRDSALVRGSATTPNTAAGVALSLEPESEASGNPHLSFLNTAFSNAGIPAYSNPEYSNHDPAGSTFADDSDEPGFATSAAATPGPVSTTVQYEFQSLGTDLNAALTLIASRACSITRGTGAAVALMGEMGMTCRALAGRTKLEIGAPVNISSGFTGECVRGARPLRCDDADSDQRVDAEACQQLGIRSILAAPVVYERDIVGLLEVFSSGAFAFDDGDLAVVERLAQTVVLTVRRGEALR